MRQCSCPECGLDLLAVGLIDVSVRWPQRYKAVCISCGELLVFGSDLRVEVLYEDEFNSLDRTLGSRLFAERQRVLAIHASSAQHIH